MAPQQIVLRAGTCAGKQLVLSELSVAPVAPIDTEQLLKPVDDDADSLAHAFPPELQLLDAHVAKLHAAVAERVAQQDDDAFEFVRQLARVEMRADPIDTLAFLVQCCM